MCANHSDEHPSDEEPFGPAFFVRNLRQPGPLGWKVQRTLANTWIKISRRQHCCGHAGEPGC
jgi:hypothetical protein